MSRSNLKHLEKVEDAVKSSAILDDEAKSQTLQKIKEWYREDKAEGIIWEELVEISQEMLPILKEIGLM